MDRPSQATPLERDLLARFHQAYKDMGFPAAHQITVRGRDDTGSGRYTYLDHEGEVRGPDGRLGLGRYSQLDMEGLEAGASFWVELQDGRVRYLEIAVNGDEPWDGVERPWNVCDPQTGLFGEETPPRTG